MYTQENINFSTTRPVSPFRAVSPLREAGAYEYLWDKGSFNFKKLAEWRQSNPEEFLSESIPPNDLESYSEQLYSIISEIQYFGVRIYNTLDYPSKLRDARHPLEVVYFQGDWDLVYENSVAIVGTRNPTPEGELRAKKLSKSLVGDGYTVVSGLAKGIDTAAHKAALENNGKTIGVLGTPLSESYPKQNKDLQSLIGKDFLLVSQVPFIRYSKQGPHINRFFFPERNKTMSALSLATVIVEASDTSGTLVQARAALEQGRQIFILDSCFKNPHISWPEKFLSKGALRVKDYEQIRYHLQKAKA